MAVFAVTTMQGPRWDSNRDIREQEQWNEHADFADMLVARGSILLGGPVESSDDRVVALIAVDAADEAAVHALFADDPWIRSAILQLEDVRSWSIWLDGRDRRPAVPEGRD